MNEEQKADKGYVFKVVYYMSHDDSRACNLWTLRFRREADRIRFYDARVPVSLGINQSRGNILYAQLQGDMDLDRSMYEVFAFRVQLPNWYYRTQKEGEELLNQEIQFPNRFFPEEEWEQLDLDEAISMSEPDSLVAHQLLAEQLLQTVAKVGLERLQLRQEGNSAFQR